jgi:hypothetical protein
MAAKNTVERKGGAQCLDQSRGAVYQGTGNPVNLPMGVPKLPESEYNKLF